MRRKNVLVVGLGLSGVSAANFLIKTGAKVTITDHKKKNQLSSFIKSLSEKVRLKLGGFPTSVSSFDRVIVSPGVSWTHPLLRQARKKGIPVWPELELGWRAVHPKTSVAITGTNGKTTTTRLVEFILKKAKKNVQVGGNIGRPLTSFVSKVKSNTILVLEVSSYQLEAHQTVHPALAVWLNLTPDHLGRHGSLLSYAKAKARLFKLMNSKDVVILNRNDVWCRRMGKKSPSKKVWFPNPKLKRLARCLTLPGTHNQENAMAAIGVAKALKIPETVIRQALRRFKGVRHRLQSVRQWKGRKFINDSKSTNVDSTKVALNSLTGPIVLILGGRHKGTSYKGLIPFMKKKVQKVFAIGEAAPLIKKELGNQFSVRPVSLLQRAVKEARRQSQKGGTILFSPACASFDQYDNYEKRGDHFVNLVKAIKV